MQSRRATLEQRAAHPRHDVEAERADRRGVVAEPLETAPDPAWNLRAARVGKARELREARNWHDAGHDRHADVEVGAIVDEAPIRVRVEEILRDRRVRAGVDLAHEA